MVGPCRVGPGAWVNAGMRNKRTIRMVAAALVVTGALGACGDDADDESTATTAAAGGDEGSGGDGGGGDDALVSACDAYAAIPDAIPDDGPPEDPAAVEQLLVDLETGAPDSVQADVTTLNAALREALGGNPDALTEEVFGLYSGIGAGMVQACPADQVIDVTAVEYEFQGIPDTLPAGKVNVAFTNGGEEVHEFVVVRRNDDVTDPFEDILALDEEEALAKVTDIGFTFATQGEHGAAFLDLEPGDYAAVCFVPVGSVDPEAEVDGPPHFTQGMLVEFSVE